MTQRSPGSVFLLSVVTLGLYEIFWTIATKDEMVQKGADIPTAWLLLVPLANIWWGWRWSKAVEQTTHNAIGATATFLYMSFLGPIGAMIVQGKLNGSAGAAGRLATA